MQKTLVNIDINTRSQITQTGEFVNRRADYVRIERASWSILCFQFYDRQVTQEGEIVLTPYPITSNALTLLADCDFDTSTAVMLKAISSVTPFDPADPLNTNAFNIAGDWIDDGTADPSKGQISVRIYSNTQRFNTVLGNKYTSDMTCYLSVRQMDAGMGDSASIVWIPFIPYNTILESEPTVIVIPDAATVAEVLSSYFTRPFQYQYSVDNVNWHNTQQDGDIYMRMRMGNAQDAVSQVWSSGFLISGNIRWTTN